MSMQGVDGVLTQLRALQARSGEIAPAADKSTDSSESVDFQAALSDALNAVNDKQSEAKDLSTAFVQGNPDVEVADVMLALNKASVSFKTLAEVRNRLVSAYQDIMNMPV
nr:flagellar hook-basal body complex protein FliE [Oceanococcus sp. HetDA_MAG_MS8]